MVGESPEALLPVPPPGLSLSVDATKTNFEITAGIAEVASITISSQKNHKAVTAIVSEDLAPYVTVDPTTFPLKPRASSTISVAIHVPAGAPRGFITGTIDIFAPLSNGTSTPEQKAVESKALWSQFPLP